MNEFPDKISYGALLIVINERLKLPRELEEQKYFVELANECLRLYWAEQKEIRLQTKRRKAA